LAYDFKTHSGDFLNDGLFILQTIARRDFNNPRFIQDCPSPRVNNGRAESSPFWRPFLGKCSQTLLGIVGGNHIAE
jgi:hypothetical protein